MKSLFEIPGVPLANNLLNEISFNEKKYPIKIGYFEETGLVQLYDNAPAETMFNESYVYDSSKSMTMVNHFTDIAVKLKNRFKPKSVLEIGANSGIFIQNFEDKNRIAVEPCKNFSDHLNDKGIITICEFWDFSLSNKLKNNYGEMDLIFSANTISHIQELDLCFKGIENILSENGVFILESPSLKSILKNNIIDQFYHEHHSFFSLYSITNLLKDYNLEVFDVEEIDVHGGSLRFYISKKRQKINRESIQNILSQELEIGIGNYDILKSSFTRMIDNLYALKKMLQKLKKDGFKIIGYGATAKLSLILNIANIGNDLVDYVLDTTPYKFNKYIPGVNIKVKEYDIELVLESDYILLGAWNYKQEILNKEKTFIKKGGKFITHIPSVSFC